MTQKIDLTIESKYQLLLQIANLTRDTLDLDLILNQLLDQVNKIVDYDAAGIFILVSDLVYQRYTRHQGVIASVVRRGFDDLPFESDPMLSLGKGIIGAVIASGESIVLPDVRLDSRYVVGRKQTQSEIAVPIVRNGRAIGALNVESDQPAAYGLRDLEGLQFFADAAALSIDKAMLHLQLLDKEHLEEQLRLAHEVQARLLPANPPEIPGYRLAGACLPAYEIGGDYYDFIHLDQHRTGLVVADVVGNGVPAALVMSAFRALLRSHARRETDPAELAQSLNRMLPEFSGRGDFVTTVYGVLDARQGRFSYTTCGHNPPLLIRACGEIESLSVRGPALGVFLDGHYQTCDVLLDPGDVLLLYTDGVVELPDEHGDYYGEARLSRVLSANCQRSAQEILQHIIEDTHQFSESDLYRDDFTLLIVQRES